jgi:tRNA-specific 2-thiouridylase
MQETESNSRTVADTKDDSSRPNLDDIRDQIKASIGPGIRTVYVAMSGGVDSSAVAALCASLDYEVIGVSLRLYAPEQERSDGFESAPEFGSCCSLDDLAVARRQAMDLGIRHYTLDMVSEFRENVYNYYLDEYGKGRTPSPCVKCNDHIKFDHLFDVLKDEESVLVTGHYAILEQENGGVALRRGIDEIKDQSYFLARSPLEKLKRIRFPLGAWTKEQVREISRAIGLRTAEKKESQDLCFVPGNDNAGFLEKKLTHTTPGTVRLLDGAVLGEHSGIHRFTPGQRKGLGIAHSEPLYVRNIDSSGEVVVAGRSKVYADRFSVADLQWIQDVPSVGDDLLVQIRYRSKPVEALFERLEGGYAVVRTKEPQFAPAPGQLVAVYRGDQVLGGGFLEETFWES